jgi:long-subunit acyl-CoA synthetase (AMP-forming)
MSKRADRILERELLALITRLKAIKEMEKLRKWEAKQQKRQQESEKNKIKNKAIWAKEAKNVKIMIAKNFSSMKLFLKTFLNFAFYYFQNIYVFFHYILFRFCY